MRKRTNGPVATILMLVPLLSVPLLAIFGIPQFVPVVASPVNSDNAFKPEPLNVLPAVGVGESARYPAEDIFAPFNAGEVALKKVRPAASHRQRSRFEQPADEWRTDPFGDEPQRRAELQQTQPQVDRSIQRPSAQLSPSHIVPTQPANNTSPTTRRLPANQAEELTWSLAVRRLNELGIRQYRLQPGEQEFDFHFSCFFTPADNPRVRHRFEAEATEPLRAVQKVLDQIQEWLQLRQSE